MRVFTTISFSASLLVQSITAFNAASTDNVVVYWGQNSAGSQGSLATYCQDSTIDIIPISFLTAFGVGAYSLNFANACEGTTVSGSTLLQCDRIAEDIKTCQTMGKKILLSVGGAAGSYGFSSSSQAVQVANDLWNYFGGGSSSIRPFGSAIVDGFDLDIENNAPAYYPDFITQMRNNYATDVSRPYYISGAPQCVYPDASLANALADSYFDFLFIQFYNNWCGVYQYGTSSGAFNYDTWNTWATTVSKNSAVRLYLGVAAAQGAANAGTGYVAPSVMVAAAQDLKAKYPNSFGGIMMWDASQAYANTPSGYSINYAQIAKQALTGAVAATSPKTTTTPAAVTTTTPADPIVPVTTAASPVEVVTTTAPAAAPTTAAAAAVTTASSAASVPGSCAQKYTVVAGDYCYAIWTSHGLSDSDFFRLNPSLSAATSCAIFPGDVLCVAAGSSSTSVESTSTSTTTVKVTSTSTTTTTVRGTSTVTSTKAAAAASTSSATTPSASTCPDVSAPCTDGAYTCNGYGYLQCDHGFWLQRSCPSGTACAGTGPNIYCDWPGPNTVDCTGITNHRSSKRGLIPEPEAGDGDGTVTTSMSQQRLNGTHFIVTLKAQAVGILPIPDDWFFSFDSDQTMLETDTGILYRDGSDGMYSVSADPRVDPPNSRTLVVHLVGMYKGLVVVPERKTWLW
ncbi:protein of unknown function [Taphrina deformans PYCC 5710]|uniref:chitinase n=1 Tax=Taphrina deformans (strain PYCC 5710 / ATCC 11124 / CBS 356.35 / IMI 108563 / JCM 9778 / NBRC 8474) TaxID=1097556 RepID=R4XLX5_TAPDE|nr:protein of unknown function [Taphrina deformans PYCC 5710]|eukprot:CCG84295.1 protein of unknown function [Taphrina deformans PYCC 5710]